MAWPKDRILNVLDECCENFTFPMLDNGYFYLAASRLSAFRSAKDWHLAIETFGFSPREGLPSIHIYHFGSDILRQKRPEDFVDHEAFASYLNNNPNNELDFVYPLDDGDWIDLEVGEAVVQGATIIVRGTEFPIPHREEFASLAIRLEDSSDLYAYELCRFLAATNRELVLASEDELRKLVPDHLDLVLRLDEWSHPNVVDPEHKASSSETFQQIADVLETGTESLYQPTSPANTHWSHWPEGGQL